MIAYNVASERRTNRFRRILTRRSDMTNVAIRSQQLPIGLNSSGSTTYLGTRNTLVFGSAPDLSIPMDQMIVSSHVAGREVSMISLDADEGNHQHLRPHLDYLATTPEAARDHLRDAVAELHRRLRLLNLYEASSWVDLPSSAAVRPITIVIDDALTLIPPLASLFRGPGDPSRVSIRMTAMSFVKQLARGNRAGIQTIVGASNIDRATLPERSLLLNLPTRVFLVPLGNADAQVIEDAVRLLNVQPGQFTRLVDEASAHRRGLTLISDYHSERCDSFWPASLETIEEAHRMSAA